jgi:predicted ATPase/DNA-binding CsgD family transcriptional regulator
MGRRPGHSDEKPDKFLTRRQGEILALLAHGYSGPEIAEQLVLAISSVRSHVVQIYGKLGANTKRQALTRAAELGLLGTPAPAAGALNGSHPPTLTGLPNTGLYSADANSFPSAPAQVRPPNNLPLQVAPFFGREHELARLTERLTRQRLVTLTGSGGVGKTRLSLQIAEAVLPDFSDGAWFVQLAPISNPELVAQTVAKSIGLRLEAGQPILALLNSYLRTRRALLVLDNCEHVLEAAAQLADAVLQACPHITLLVTSREPLGVAGESVFAVPSLDYPKAGQVVSAERLGDYASVALFVDRVRLVLPGYQLDARNAPHVAHICQRLEGLPLALELAAARMNLLTAQQLASRLDDVLRLLTGGRRTALPRQKTLRATINWSYDLLNVGDRLLLQRLSVFAGGCTLEAAEAVCASEGLEAGSVLEGLAALVAKSMVIADRQQDQETRYRLLEMMRQFAHEKLLEAGTGERLSRRHAEYFVKFAETNAPQLRYRERPAWLRRFNAERENLRLALEWSFSSAAGGELGPRLTVALHPFWLVRDSREAGIWFAKAMTSCQDKTAPALTAGVLAYSDYYLPSANLAATQQSVALSRGLGPEGRELLLEGLGTLVTLVLDRGRDWDHYQALLDERDALIQSLGPDSQLDPRFYRANNILLRAQAEFERGQSERATALALESMRWFEACAHGVSLIWPYRLLGHIANKAGAHAKAIEYFSVGLRLAIEDDETRHGQMLIFLCDTAMLQADWARALEYCQAFIKLAYEKQTPFWVLERLEMGAIILIQAGRYPAAARLSGAAEALSDQLGRKTSPEGRLRFGHGDETTRYADVSLEALFPDWRTRPDGETIQQAWQDGRAMSYQQVVAHALAER